MRLINRYFFWPVVTFAALQTMHGEPRTFTSPDGRSLEAEIVSASDQTVTLKIPDGRSIVSDIAKFSMADRAYIAKWRKANPTAIRYSFKVTYAEERVNNADKKDIDRGGTIETWRSKIKLLNQSGQQLNDVTVHYVLHYQLEDNNEALLRKMGGSQHFSKIEHLKEGIIQTATIQLHSRKMYADVFMTKGGKANIVPRRAKYSDTLLGTSIRVEQNGKTVFEWSSGGVPKVRP